SGHANGHATFKVGNCLNGNLHGFSSPLLFNKENRCMSQTLIWCERRDSNCKTQDKATLCNTQQPDFNSNLYFHPANTCLKLQGCWQKSWQSIQIESDRIKGSNERSEEHTSELQSRENL